MDADIIRMAREADEYADKHTPLFVTVPNEWQEIRDKRFAALVRADEREACAAICDTTPPYPFRPSIEAAHAIRARSKG